MRHIKKMDEAYIKTENVEVETNEKTWMNSSTGSTDSSTVKVVANINSDKIPIPCIHCVQTTAPVSIDSGRIKFAWRFSQ